LTATPVTVDDDLRRPIAAALTPKQAVELTNIIAWENARARFNRGFDVQPDGYDA
jgi:alkylhydroperoxidase family enzyme